MSEDTLGCGDPTDHFYGSVTVGDRGQVVIPAALRREVGIVPGDRLLVFRHGPGGGPIVMAKVDSLRRFLSEQLSFLDRATLAGEEHEGGDEVDGRTVDGGGTP